jgi:hypothetical protein
MWRRKEMSISAMKQALEAMEEIYRTGDTQAFDLCYAPNVIPALRQAIEQAEKQEPVAFRNIETGEFCTGGFLRKDWAKWQPLYASPVHASDISQEPVDETPPCKTHPDAPHGFDRNASHSADRYVCECEGWEPPREWVGLTDEEIKDIREDLTYDDEDFNELEFARDIEAKLRKKNTVELTDEELERELPAEAFGELSPVWKKNFKEEEHMNQVRTHTPEDIQAITRKWKGLTNEEIADVWKTEYFNISYELPRAIEAKLKEKNNG